MADILTEAQRVLDEAQEAIAWIAFWKNGQSWNAVAFWPEVDEGVPHWDDTEVNLLNDILKQDPNAIVVNAYYTALSVACKKVIIRRRIVKRLCLTTAI